MVADHERATELVDSASYSRDIVAARFVPPRFCLGTDCGGDDPSANHNRQNRSPTHLLREVCRMNPSGKKISKCQLKTQVGGNQVSGDRRSAPAPDHIA